jgi:hypothetical protein
MAFPILLHGSKILTLQQKGEKGWHQLSWNFSEEHKQKRKKIGRAESRTSWWETKKIEIKLALTCNKNGQQQDAKNILNYRPNGQRQIWRPLKRLLGMAERGVSRPHLMLLLLMMM